MDVSIRAACNRLLSSIGHLSRRIDARKGFDSMQVDLKVLYQRIVVFLKDTDANGIGYFDRFAATLVGMFDSFDLVIEEIERIVTKTSNKSFPQEQDEVREGLLQRKNPRGSDERVDLPNPRRHRYLSTDQSRWNRPTMQLEAYATTIQIAVNIFSMLSLLSIQEHTSGIRVDLDAKREVSIHNKKTVPSLEGSSRLLLGKILGAVSIVRIQLWDSKVAVDDRHHHAVEAFLDKVTHYAQLLTGRDGSKPGIELRSLGSTTLVESMDGKDEEVMEAEEEETMTTYSDASSMSSEDAENLMHTLPDELFIVARSVQPDTHIIENVSQDLPGLLKSFALRLGYNAKSQIYRDVMYSVRKYRSRIAVRFREKCFSDRGIRKELGALDSDAPAWKEKVTTWFDTEDPRDEDTETVILKRGIVHDDKTRSLPEDKFRDVIFKLPAYEWLLSSLRRELLMASIELNSMRKIRNKIFDSLPCSHQKVSRKRSVEPSFLVFKIDWDPLAFVKEQAYGVGFDVAVESAIILTGSAGDAQAVTCGQYFRQTWPLTGGHLIEFLKKVVRNRRCEPKTYILPDGTELTGWISSPKFIVECFGSGDAIAEIGEQLAWVCAALRPSLRKDDSGICYYTPAISDVQVNLTSPPSQQIIREFEFKLEKIGRDRSNGQCWQAMFRNPVLVNGYPIPRRSHTDTGLEIPFNMMAGLIGTQRVNAFKGNLFLKGFSSMLVPVERFDDIVVWHFLHNADGARIPYLDHSLPLLADLDFRSIETGRHMVGWCSEVKICTGAADSSYTIERSRLPPPHSGCALEKVSVSGGSFITGGASFLIGTKDKPIHLSRNHYLSKLKWISSKFVVLWDEEDKRGWLVNGISALLHLLRASLKYNETDRFKSALLLKSEMLKDPPATGDFAIEVLLDKDNMKLPIYPDKGEFYEEETERMSGSVEQISRKKKTFYRLEDRVEELYEILEKIIDHQVDVTGQNGVKLKAHLRKHLEGWDFKDLATDKDPVYPRVAKLHTVGKGWVDLVRSIHAVNLFGRGFGDLIRPNTTDTCSHWINLPKGKFYLAVSTADLKHIIELDGDPTKHPIKLSNEIVWHNPNQPFDLCQCTKDSQNNHSDFVQVVWPANLSRCLPGRSPIKLPDRGAVIFGHSLGFRWHWGDTGDPIEGEPPTLTSTEAQTEFHDSGIGSSAESSRTSGHENPSTSTSRRPPEESSLESSLPVLSDTAISTMTMASHDSGRNPPSAAPEASGNITEPTRHPRHNNPNKRSARLAIRDGFRRIKIFRKTT